MLPQNVFQIDYQQFTNLVYKDLDKLFKYQQTTQKFDLILGKFKQGMLPANIISQHLNVEMGIIKNGEQVDLDNVFASQEIKDKIYSSPTHILFVDAVNYSGNSLYVVDSLFKSFPHVKLTSYCPLVATSSEFKPNIIGIESDKFIQPPWEWTSFTPQAHLNRLETGETKTQENKFCLGFSSEELKTELNDYLNESHAWIMTFQYNEEKLSTTSGISSHNVSKEISFLENKTKYKNILKAKVEFIEKNGLTHFVEDNLTQAVLISTEVPICKVLFYDSKYFYRISANKENNEFLFNQV